MGLSFTFKINWDAFWENQQSNPNCELAFKYRDKTYILLHTDYKWIIAEYDDCVYETGNVLAECSEKLYGHKDYHNQDNWYDSIQKCYEVLNTPCFSGQSFKDIIDDIVFEA